ncbi:DUF3305 domain-containing protein [Actimicrobium antarcticum]|uniref:DUF3305 domain-containing protein n=1 Tax=Actimicrobium antarcticum TaxID=1051899 RepID=A0ABP7SZI3_9BURK
METEALNIGVVMQRLRIDNRWQSHQWQPLEILSGVPDERRCLRGGDDDQRWLFGGFDVRLYSDEAEGYFLNISSPAPCWFVMWRMEEVDGVEIAVPKTVTLSYHEGARLMDGGEKVDTIAASADIIERLTAFVKTYYVPEQKRKRRKPSFEGGAAVAQMALDEGKPRGS